MDSIYQNTDFVLSTHDPDKGSQHKTEQESKREVSSSQWTKILLIGLAVSLLFALGGLCVLAILYVRVSVQLTTQETNGTLMARELEDLTANYTRVQEDLYKNHIKMRALTANYTRIQEYYLLHLAMKKEFEDLTGRYNTLREWLSFYDAQSCNLSVNDWIACRGKLYLFISDKLNWSSSQDVCVSKGADLVTITSQSEQEFLVAKITENHWIGLTDLETEGHWVWVNNQTLYETGVQFWFSSSIQKEPDNWKVQDPSGENCASLGDSIGNFQSWFDASCKTKKKFICEKKY